MLILAVASIPAGAIAAGAGLEEATPAALLGWLYFHCGWPDMFWRSGLFAFVTASAGLVLLIGLLLRFERRPVAGRWAALAGAGAALWFVHVTLPILVLGAAIGLTATAARRHPWRWLWALVAAAMLALAVNLLWLVPLWRFRDIRSPRAFFMAPAFGLGLHQPIPERGGRRLPEPADPGPGRGRARVLVRGGPVRTRRDLRRGRPGLPRPGHVRRPMERHAGRSSRSASGSRSTSS